MESISRKTIKSGNASAVVLPKSWLNMNVRIELLEKNKEIILQDVLDIVKSSIDLSEIIGVYLVGSYARKDNEYTSDIDVLIISEKTNRELINYIVSKYPGRWCAVEVSEDGESGATLDYEPEFRN